MADRSRQTTSIGQMGPPGSARRTASWQRRARSRQISLGQSIKAGISFSRPGRTILMPKGIQEDLPTYDGTDAATPFAGPLGEYIGRRISSLHGLKLLGANLEILMPEASSSLGHWHDLNDELVVVLKGELVLVDNVGGTALGAGEIAVRPAGGENGPYLLSSSPARLCERVERDCQHNDHANYDLLDVGRYVQDDQTVE